MRLLVWTTSSGFFGQDGDRQAGYERSRHRILMNSRSYSSFHPRCCLPASLFNYSRHGKKAPISSLLSRHPTLTLGDSVSPQTRGKVSEERRSGRNSGSNKVTWSGTQTHTYGEREVKWRGSKTSRRKAIFCTIWQPRLTPT